MSPTSPPATSSWPTPGQFQTGGEDFNADMAVPEDVIDDIDAQGGITDGGVIYGQTSGALEFVTEDYFRAVLGAAGTPRSSWTTWSA